MSREILFRVWDVEVKRMSVASTLYSYAIFWKDGDAPMPLPMLIREERFLKMQFTGLFDKNGKRIFEGDIVKRIFVNEHLQEIEQLWEVYWGQWCWMKKKSNGIGFSFDSIEARDSEVIGNIHDNPELLSERSVVSGRK